MTDAKAMLGAELCFLNFIPLWAVVIGGDILSLHRQGWGWHEGGAEWCALAGIALGMFVAVRDVERKIRKRPANVEEYRLKRIEAKKTLTAEVLMTYVLPLFAFTFTRWTGLAAFLVFFAVVVWLAAKYRVMSGSLYLEFRGFHCYELEGTKSEEEKCSTMLVLSRNLLGGREGEIWEIGMLNDQLRLAIQAAEGNKVENAP